MRYFIDDDRAADWLDTNPTPRRLRASAEPEQAIENGDIVFAHLTNYEPLGERCVLHDALLDRARAGRTPTIVMYTGHSPEEGDEEEYRRAMVGFPRDKVFFLPMGPGYGVRDVVNEYDRRRKDSPMRLTRYADALKTVCQGWSDLPPRPDFKAMFLKMFKLPIDISQPDAEDKISQLVGRKLPAGQLPRLLTAIFLGELNHGSQAARAIGEALQGPAGDPEAAR